MPSQKQQPFSRLLIAGVVVFIAVLVFFSPTFSHQFINWDDPAYVTDNPMIKSLDWASVAAMFGTGGISQLHHYAPLVLLSYAIEYKFAGLNPSVFHGTNVVLHAISAALVLWIVFRLSGSISFSLFVTLLFALHPLRVESVAWVTERKDTLSGVFFFSALLAYIMYLQRHERKALLAATGILFLFSLLSKTMAISFPVVMLLVDYLLGRTFDRQSALEKLPFFLVSILFGVLSLTSLPSGSSLQQAAGGSIAFSEFDRLLIAGYGVLFYLVKLFVPLNLSVLYGIPTTDAGTLPWYMYFAPLLVLGGMAALFAFRKKTPMLVFAGAFFLITLGPVSQIIPVGVATIADRFTYIPSFGLALFVGAGFLLLRDHVLSPRGIKPSVLSAAAIIWIGILASMTIGRSKVWHDDITLWTSVIDQPSPPAMAYLQRGIAHASALRPRDAAADYTRAIQQDSSFTLAWNNRGNVFARAGNYDQALSDYRQALRSSPDYADAYINMGRVQMLQKNYEESLASYGRALELDERNALIHYYRGQVHMNLGNLDSALVDYDRALELNPDMTEAYVRRGDVYFQEQKFKEAIDSYTQGINRGASHELLFTNRGSSYANLGDYDKAIEDFSKALEINPNYVDALTNRGIAFIAKKDYRLALVHFNMLENMGYPQDPKIMKFLREQAAAQEKKSQ